MVVRPLFRAALLLVVSAAAATAQQLTGSIEGSVIDAGGAAIPDASISALHDETNTLYEAATGATGQFRIPNARLGTYTVRTEADGFKRSVATGVLVEVGGTAGLRISLELGELRFEVTVAAEDVQTIINTLDAELSTTVDNRRVLELPLNGRNAAELAMQQAGVYYERAPQRTGRQILHPRATPPLDPNFARRHRHPGQLHQSLIDHDQPALAGPGG